MSDFGDYILAVLAEFGSGRGDPLDEYVRFGLGSLFFGVLLVISLRHRKSVGSGRENYLAIGFALGLAREVFKFAIKSLETHGGVDTAVLELFFPPLEHALFAAARVFIAAGFIYYLLGAKRFANGFLAVGVAFVCVYYATVAPLWWSYVVEEPTIKFSHVLFDGIIHIFGMILGAVAVVAFFTSNRKGRYIAIVAFSAFLLDDLLQLVNLGTGESYKAVFAPIRHNLHIWAIAILGYLYLREHTSERERLEETLDTAIRIAGIGHFSFDTRSGNCTYCSEQHAAHLGLTPDEFMSKTASPVPMLSYVHPDDRRTMVDAIERVNEGNSQTFEYRAVLPNGETRHIQEIEEPVFDQSGDVIANVGTSVDLTSLREAESRARQSQRIEAMGSLTGGVAHDFNNILAAILGNLELSLETDNDEEREQSIHAAIKATIRGAGLTKNLLSFARRAHLEPAIIDLNKTIQSTISWGKRVLPATIQIKNSLTEGLWNTELDRTSVENALINILLNARDAMPDGGKITIETANLRIGEVEENGMEFSDKLDPGRYVVLTVGDTGKGIPPEKLETVFEPFYTDKPVGQGSGLGLSMVQGFIRQSGGAIRLFSEVGVGTTIKLYFKAAEPNHCKFKSEATDQYEMPAGQQFNILVAEDEEDVLRVLERILVGAGYQVTTAASGDEALEIFKSHGRFDLLLTDIVMPGELQGPLLAKAIQAIEPDFPCILLSGHALEPTIHSRSSEPSGIRLMKPIARFELLEAVSHVLEQKGRTSKIVSE